MKINKRIGRLCTRCLLNTSRYSYGTFKMKDDQFAKAKKVTNTDRALEHFDLHYKPVYQDEWPSIRIALLTSKKMCAVMNTFALQNSFLEEFFKLGAHDILLKAVHQQRLIEQCAFKGISDNKIVGDDKIAKHSDSVSMNTADIEETLNIPEDTELDRTNLDRTNLYSFIPAETVYSETQQLRIEEARRSVFTPMDVKVDIVKPRKIALPQSLSVMSFPAGDVTEFPDVKSDMPNGHLCFYMMDAASVLPVIALDLEKGDSVLDLCAAPGGKALTILQTKLPDSLTCNDLSGSRLSRLQNILKFYIPESQQVHIKVTRKSGLDFTEPVYDKVLVDVPCNTDRHVLLDDTNNLFHPGRITERIQLPILQKDLLVSGIKSCRPGGCVVYSTCTLSPAQNDGVVQSALDELWKLSNMEVVVEDLSEIKDLFKDTFQFYDSCRFGQLVLPSLSSNYGPMYFCRIRRIS